jgi:hypothetical protein
MLVQQLGSLRKRTDVEQMIGPRVRPPETYDQSYTNSFQYAVRGSSLQQQQQQQQYDILFTAQLLAAARWFWQLRKEPASLQPAYWTASQQQLRCGVIQM